MILLQAALTLSSKEVMHPEAENHEKKTFFFYSVIRWEKKKSKYLDTSSLIRPEN